MVDTQSWVRSFLISCFYLQIYKQLIYNTLATELQRRFFKILFSPLLSFICKENVIFVP